MLPHTFENSCIVYMIW